MVGTSFLSPLAWQWFRDGQSINGATNRIVSLPAQAGTYRCTVSNPLGTIQSQSISGIVKSYATCRGTAAIRDGRIRMSFATESGKTCQILVRTNLAAWTVVYEAEATGSRLEYAEPQPGPSRFFACREKAL
jgi:hypothetical protein